MSATPLPPPNQAATPGAPVGNPNFDPSAAAAMPPPPGTDMTGICFRDPLWLSTYPLDRNLVFDYFALSPFYDWTCNNEQLRSRSIHPLDLSHLSKMTGIEYMLSEVMEPHLFVIRKQKRDSPEKVTPMLTFYVLDGSIYQAPQLCNVFAARIFSSITFQLGKLGEVSSGKELRSMLVAKPRLLPLKIIVPQIVSEEILQELGLSDSMTMRKLGRAIYHISKAFTIASSKLEKIGYASADAENEGAGTELKTKETIDIKELKRVDHILASLQRKLPPAPPPPPFPEGYAPPGEGEKAHEDQQSSEAQQSPADPIIDQGPSKRMKYQS